MTGGAAKKQKLEAVEEPEELSEFVEIPYEGETFVVPRSREDWSTAGMVYLNKGEYPAFVEATLDIAKPGQWDKLCRVCPRARDYNAFFEVFGAIVNEECTG